MELGPKPQSLFAFRRAFSYPTLMTSQKPLSILAALAGLTGVAIGAFGAHGLQGAHSEYEIATFKTAANYQLIHALAMLLPQASPAQRQNGLL